MSKFEVYGKHDIRKDGVTVESVAKMLADKLAKHYGSGKVVFSPTGVTIDGNLSSFSGEYEMAVTKAEAKIEINGDQLLYRVTGDTSVGKYPFILVALGMAYNFFVDKHAEFLYVIAGLIVFIFAISRDRPKQYFEDAIREIQFEIG